MGEALTRRHGSARFKGQNRGGMKCWKELRGGHDEVSNKLILRAARNHKAKDRRGCYGFQSSSPVGFGERNKKRNGGILGEGGTVCGMAARSLI